MTDAVGVKVPEKRRVRSAHSSPNINVETIASANLFGKPIKPDKNKPTVQFVPETSLDLTLIGVVALRNSTGSQAIVSTNAEVPQVYRVGDALPGNAIIHQIDSHYIVIRRGAAFETLWLPRDKPTDRAEQMILVSLDQAETEAAAGTLAQQEIALNDDDRRLIQDAREAVFEAKTPISRFARLQAVHADGRLTGYRVFPGRSSDLFEAMRLKRGDIVTSVNGIELAEDMPTDELVAVLTRGTTLKLQVERDGFERSLEYAWEP